MKKSSGCDLYIFGKNPVVELFEKNRDIIKTLFIDESESGRKYEAIITKARQTKIDVQIISKKTFEKKLGRSAKHQGIMALIHQYPYCELEQILVNTQNDSCIIITDHIQDPQNLGSIIRNAAAFGASGILIPRANQVGVTSSVLRSSAGNAFSIPIARIGNISEIIKQLKTAGFWIIGLDGGGTDTIGKIDMSGKVAMIVGSEGDGMSRLVRENCDFIAKIPISSNIESLNVASATAIALYQWRIGL